ncbi:MAG: hypothetical protein ABR511_02590, partial [Acidimicrobiales bacterium]
GPMPVAAGAATTAPFPKGVRAPVSYGPRVRAVVADLLGRQHPAHPAGGRDPGRPLRLRIPTGAIDAVYSEASPRRRGFIAALIAFLRTLPVLHADETTDRVARRPSRRRARHAPRPHRRARRRRWVEAAVD